MAQIDYSRKVITIVSDGTQAPTLNSADYNAMIAKAEEFKQAGGIIICVGIDATGDGYALLQRLATAGYFKNVLGSSSTSVSEAIIWLNLLRSKFCAGIGYGGPFCDLY